MDTPGAGQLLRHLTLRQLQVFEAIARHRSCTRAAEELYLTQPTMSAQAKNLTEAVGLPLFEQIGKKIHITAAGEVLYTLCQEIFESLARCEMGVANLKGLKQGQLRLAVVTTAKYFVPRVLGVFCQRYPGIAVTLKVTNRERVLARLLDNRDDLYVFGQPPPEVEVNAVPFLRNPLVVIAARDHPLAGKRGIPLTRLAQEPFLVREAGSGTRSALERFCEEHGVNLAIRMDLGSNEAIKQGVAGGLGLAVLSLHTLAMEGRDSPLAVLDVEDFPIERHWNLVYPKGKQPSVVAQAFHEFMLNEGRSLAEAAVTVHKSPRRPPSHRRTAKS